MGRKEDWWHLTEEQLSLPLHLKEKPSDSSTPIKQTVSDQQCWPIFDSSEPRGPRHTPKAPDSITPHLHPRGSIETTQVSNRSGNLTPYFTIAFGWAPWCNVQRTHFMLNKKSSIKLLVAAAWVAQHYWFHKDTLAELYKQHQTLQPASWQLRWTHFIAELHTQQKCVLVCISPIPYSQHDIHQDWLLR